MFSIKFFTRNKHQILIILFILAVFFFVNRKYKIKEGLGWNSSNTYKPKPPILSAAGIARLKNK
jgi:hypothetical protein